MANNLKRAIDTGLGCLRTTERERVMIFKNALEGKKVKKKLPAAFILTVVLVLLAAGALAAILLGSKDFAGEVMAPIAANDSSEKWTLEQTNEIIRLAEKNGLAVTEEIRKHLNDADGTYKESLMRAFVKIDLGFYPASWSIEDQAWYDELLVKCGLKEERTRFLPENGEASESQAESIAVQYIREQFSKDAQVTDQGVYTRYVQYMLSEDKAGSRRKIWDIEYEAKPQEAPSFYICILSDGTVLEEESHMRTNAGEDPPLPSDVAASIEELCTLIGQNEFFTVENMAGFSKTYGKMIDGLGDQKETKYSVLRNLCLIPYGLPSAADIPQSEALRIAGETAISAGWSDTWLSRCKHTVSYRIYDPNRPEWRVCYKIDRVEDYVYFNQGEMPFGIVINLDAKTGEVLNIRELKEKDIYDFYCEFPDERDVFKSFAQGLG